MRKSCSIQQGEKKITVDQSKVLKNWLFRFFGATRYTCTYMYMYSYHMDVRWTQNDWTFKSMVRPTYTHEQWHISNEAKLCLYCRLCMTILYFKKPISNCQYKFMFLSCNKQVKQCISLPDIFSFAAWMME